MKKLHTTVLAALACALFMVLAGTAVSDGKRGGPHDHEPAGTVESFEDGVLTVKLTDGNTVSGEVTDRTKIHCRHEGHHHKGHDGHKGHRNRPKAGPSRHEKCDEDDLTAGREIQKADVKLADGKATFKHIDLLEEEDED